MLDRIIIHGPPGLRCSEREEGLKCPVLKKLNYLVQRGCCFCSNKAGMPWGCYLPPSLGPLRWNSLSGKPHERIRRAHGLECSELQG